MVSKWMKPMQDALKRLAGHRSYHEVWMDFAVYGASELSKIYPNNQLKDAHTRIADKYSSDGMESMAELMGCTIAALEENPSQDFLGSMYMELGIGNKKDGQFFTPYAVCKAMADAQISKDVADAAISEHGYITLNDPACGGGATLIAGANRLKELGIDYQNFAWFEAQDLNLETACMCYIQLSLLGCAGVVIVGNTITKERRQELMLPMNLISPWWTARWMKGETP